MRRVGTRGLAEPAPAAMANGAASNLTARRWAPARAPRRSRIAPIGRPPLLGARAARRHRYADGMPFPRKLLNSYEEVAVDLHPHWMYFAEPVLALVGALVVTIFVKFGPSFLDKDPVVLLCVAAILGCAGWLGV